jgi:uncharacterized small protein (DUF1192 family)
MPCLNFPVFSKTEPEQKIEALEKEEERNEPSKMGKKNSR